MRRRAALALALIAGCSRQTVAVDLPQLESPSALLFIERGSSLESLQIVERWAISPETTTPPPVTDLDLDHTARLTTIPLVSPLAALGLSEGSFSPPSQGEPLATVTSSQQAILERVIDPDTVGDWHVAGPLPRSISETLVPVVNPRCTLFRARQLAGFDGLTISFVLPLDDRRLLAGVEFEDRLFRIDLDGTVVEVTPPRDMFPGAGVLPTWGGFRESATIVWLSGTSGLWQVRLDGDARPVEVLGVFPSPTAHPFRWLAGRIRPGDQELFGLSKQGELLRFDGTRLEVVGAVNFELEREWRGGVAYAGRNEAFAAMNSDPEVLHYREGRAMKERVTLAPDRGNTGLDTVEGLGIVLSDGFGNLYQPEGGGWRQIVETHAVTGADSFTQFGAGHLYGSTDGLIGEFRGARDCPAEPAYLFRTVRVLMPLGGSVFAAGTPPTWLDPL